MYKYQKVLLITFILNNKIEEQWEKSKKFNNFELCANASSPTVERVDQICKTTHDSVQFSLIFELSNFLSYFLNL